MGRDADGVERRGTGISLVQVHVNLVTFVHGQSDVSGGRLQGIEGSGVGSARWAFRREPGGVGRRIGLMWRGPDVRNAVNRFSTELQSQHERSKTDNRNTRGDAAVIERAITPRAKERTAAGEPSLKGVVTIGPVATPTEQPPWSNAQWLDREDSLRARRIILLASGAMATGVAAYLTVGRTPCLTWGATDDEADQELPGDALLASPDLISTRAITIDAPPSSIWPWLMQMGSGKGGVYTYDWIENLFGLDMHSANEILPQFQDRKVGDVEQLGTSGPRMRVAILDTERAMVLQSDDGNWVWEFCLSPLGARRTRLVSRNRIATPGASLLMRMLMTLVMEPGSLVMERRMLIGIKTRAESLDYLT